MLPCIVVLLVLLIFNVLNLSISLQKNSDERSQIEDGLKVGISSWLEFPWKL